MRGGGSSGASSSSKGVEDDGFDSLDVSLAEITADVSSRSLRKSKNSNLGLALAIIFNLGVLGFFKYLPFIFSQLDELLRLDVFPSIELALPIGISFFTLQAVSYVIDVWRGEVKAQKNPLYLGMYISMFPQLVAGPIVRYSQIEDRIKQRQTTLLMFSQGIRLFIIGLGKKCLLANVCGILADSLLSQPASRIGFIGCASAVVAYSFQIYYDFGGYSDMAIGLGRMFGFEYPRNFNYPYISKSVTEFWRRWHMTLGSFFRDYVYIPLGGNRVKRFRWMLNIFVVWSLTGIWHGAEWNFLIWGLYYGVLLALEKLFLLSRMDTWPAVIRHFYAVTAFAVGWLLFSVTGLDRIVSWFMALFGFFGLTGTSTLWELQSWSYCALLPLLVVASTPLAPYLRKHLEVWIEGKREEKIIAAPERGNDQIPPCRLVVSSPLNRNRARCGRIVEIATDVGLVLILVLSLVSVVSSSYNPFIYFQF